MQTFLIDDKLGIFRVNSKNVLQQMFSFRNPSQKETSELTVGSVSLFYTNGAENTEI